MKRETHQVAIIGAGPAGLAAAIELKRLGVGDVVVIERDETAGGMPQFCDHPGFGIKDLHMMYTGPGYARSYAQRAARAGVAVRTSTTVTGWAGPTTLALTSPQGLAHIEAKAVLMATGCRERPRSARMIPGARPQGVFTTGSLQQLIHIHQHVGKKAVIVGAELVSLSAMLTLAAAGVAVARVVTELPQHQIYWPYWPAKVLLADVWMRTPIMTSARLTRILGKDRVEAVEITQATGQTEVVACDTVVLTADWIPQNELARAANIMLDPGTRGPRIDVSLRTSAVGVFAAGNLLRGAETADAAALEGRYAASRIRDYLDQGGWLDAAAPILVADPILWVAPNVVAATANDAALRPLLLKVKTPLKDATVRVQQGDRLLCSQRFSSLRPNTSERLQGTWLKDVEAGGGPVRITAGV